MPIPITADNQYPDLPPYLCYTLLYGVLEAAFSREGQGQNVELSAFFGALYDDQKKQWFGRMKEVDRGHDQMLSQRPVGFRSDLDWRFRVKG